MVKGFLVLTPVKVVSCLEFPSYVVGMSVKGQKWIQWDAEIGVDLVVNPLQDCNCSKRFSEVMLVVCRY